MTPPTTRLVQQPVLLEPDRAKALDVLSKELKTPKQVLLREAVNDLLAMHGLGTTSSVLMIRTALEQALPLIRKLATLTAGETLWQRKCFDAHSSIKGALELFEDSKSD